MRTLYISASVFVFLALAFVPPTTGDFKVYADQIQSPASTTDAIVKNWENTASMLTEWIAGITTKAIAENAPVNYAAKQLEDVQSLATTYSATALEALKNAKSWRDIVKVELQPDIRKQFEIAQFAAIKSDPDSCKSIAITVLEERILGGKTLKTPSAADFMAYCLARATHAKEKCESIASDIALPLKSLCESEVLSPSLSNA
ncbi:MAG: hypothetical protein KBD00_02230 [Candidatus Peribacteraceae bacterium]|nr:hypothetical protein [Candidatus Peribacteraceae bacterium]